MPKLEIGNTSYELNMDDSFTATSGRNEGTTYEYVSLKQLTTNREGKIIKNRQVTVKHENWNEFRTWLLTELGVEDIANQFDEQVTDEPPEEQTDLDPF